MKIVFIADAHLSGPDDENLAGVAGFIDGLEEVDTLVVLGDLFEFWCDGNSVARRAYRPVLDSLVRLAGRGVEIIYLEGNHDFSMGRFFTDTLGAKVCKQSFDLSIGNKRFYLAHGDTVAMTTGYRAWRAFLRSPLFVILKTILPDGFVWGVARYLSRRSRARGAGYGARGKEIEEKLRSFARARIEAGYDGVVLAHSHRAGVYEEECSTRKGVYANPGAWSVQGTYLECDNGSFRVREVEAGKMNRP